ncbi:hypothetical protein K435DRAFT_863189 [Dendrothele bispora CBS 962.96]|uniref:Uncharacterized protein n=1 Tax=Dendrothele bispora (strain CBS 962.96) TaxID=1314807 RepID=A0A4S8LQG1_DENBC|nr:hypothetical protein K435DRAFT_863189 [Dendrothele bispora CBS 962.96]
MRATYFLALLATLFVSSTVASAVPGTLIAVNSTTLKLAKAVPAVVVVLLPKFAVLLVVDAEMLLAKDKRLWAVMPLW